jgi:hypothetical protein
MDALWLIRATLRSSGLRAGLLGARALPARAKVGEEGLGMHWTINPDYLLPHNLAHHDLSIVDIGLPKAASRAKKAGVAYDSCSPLSGGTLLASSSTRN